MNKYDITTSKLSLQKQLIALSFPALVSLSVQALYNVVDKLYIGNIPELSINGLAALTAVNPILNIIIAIGTMFGIGGSVFYSISLGKGDEEASRKVLGNTCFLLIISNIIFVVLLLIFFEPISRVLGISDAVMGMAKTYFFTIAPFSIFWAVGLGMNNFIRADGKALYAMISILSGAITNIVLDALFVLVFRWGIFGVGLATGLGQLASFIFVMWFFRSKKCRFPLKVKDIKFSLKRTKIVSYYGIPSLITVVCNTILNLYIIKVLTDTRVLNGYPAESALAVQGIIFSLISLLHIPINAFCQGMQPLIGYNYGKKQYDNVIKIFKLCLKYTMSISTVVCILLMVFSKYVVLAFDGTRQLGDVGPNAIRLWNSLMPLVAFELVSIALFQAMGYGRKSVFLIMFRQVFVLILSIMILKEKIGIWGVFASMPIADTLTSLLLFAILIVVMKNLKKRGINEKESS